MDHKAIIRDVAQKAGGVIALSRSLGLSRAAVSQWRKVPAERLIAVSRLTGVPPEQIRPDLYADGQQQEAA